MDRKILEYDEQTMLVEVAFGKGETGEMHSHEHVQFTYVLDGTFEFTKGKEKITVSKGETLHVPSNVEHGVVCMEKGALLDVFSPMRKDFL